MIRDFLAAISGNIRREYFDRKTCSLTVSVIGLYGDSEDTIYTFQDNSLRGKVIVSNDEGGGHQEEIRDIPYDVRFTHFLYRVGLKKGSTPTPQ